MVVAVEACAELQYFCLADIGVAVVRSAFAQLVLSIGKEGKDSMTHSEITEKAKELLKYDVGFCLYFFFFVAAFCFNCYGITDVNCSDTSYLMGAIGLMLVYGVVAWHFACCWYCGQCCFGKAEKRGIVRIKGSESASSSGPSGAMVGAPAA
mmetsp:Transcript_62845/g.146321  ORF Transcript_62845/g.146321 Transcript_62845/m.146321 type:complete len:152 (-) Transcript_62845:70-525(-)